jgi:sigma-B regulation protein RsbU (phosphoserine phosphatase)
VYVNAGHNPPLVKKHGSGYEFLKTEPCLVLAWMDDVNYREEEIILEPGDVLYLYTDGVTEAMNSNRDFFSEQRLLEVLNANKDCAPKELLSAIKQEVDNFAGGAEQTDDITMLALKITSHTEGIIETPEEDTSTVLEVEASVENLNKVLDFVNAELEWRNYPDKAKGEIDIAVEEVFINIANYAYATGKGKAFISISTAGKMTIRFEDTGKPYNPLEQPDPDLDKPVEEREPGGLGVFLVKKLMNNIEYSRVGNKNILSMSYDIASLDT